MACFLILAVLAGPLSLPAAEPADPSGKRTLSLDELFGDSVIARAQGVEIRQSQLDSAFLAYRATLAARNRDVPPTQRLFREAALLDRIIITKLLTNRASNMDRTVAAAMAERFYTRTKQDAGSDESFARQLKVTGLTPEQFNHRVLEQSLAEAVLDRELKSKIAVTETEIAQYYENGLDERIRLLQEEIARQKKQPQASPEILQNLQDRMEQIRKANLSNLEIPEKVRVTHVLISTRIPNRDNPLPQDQQLQKRRQAEDVLRRAQAGEDFSELVQKFSEDRRLPESGGIYIFSKDDPFAVEFKAASFSLAPGQISDIVQTEFGYHIIKLLEKFPAGKRPLAEVQEPIREILIQQKLQVQMPAFFKRLKADANVQILEAKYKNALPPDYASALEPDSGEER